MEPEFINGKESFEARKKKMLERSLKEFKNPTEEEINKLENLIE